MTVVATPYILPFPVLIEPAPLFSKGTDVALTVEMVGVVTDKALEMSDSFVDSFCVLAGTGALGGDAVPPWISTIADKGEARSGPESISWSLKDCRTDDRALVILVNLLLSVHETYPLRRVSVGGSTLARPHLPLSQDPGIQNPYPPRWPAVRFRSAVEAFTTDSRTLSIDFEREPSEQERSDIETELLSWSVAPTVGAYAVAPVSPMSSYLIPTESVEITGTELLWTLQKVRLHPAALDGLVNVCVAIDHNLVRIDELRITG